MLTWDRLPDDFRADALARFDGSASADDQRHQRLVRQRSYLCADAALFVAAEALHVARKLGAPTYSSDLAREFQGFDEAPPGAGELVGRVYSALESLVQKIEGRGDWDGTLPFVGSAEESELVLQLVAGLVTDARSRLGGIDGWPARKRAFVDAVKIGLTDSPVLGQFGFGPELYPETFVTGAQFITEAAAVTVGGTSYPVVGVQESEVPVLAPTARRQAAGEAVEPVSAGARIATTTFGGWYPAIRLDLFWDDVPVPVASLVFSPMLLPDFAELMDSSGHVLLAVLPAGAHLEQVLDRAIPAGFIGFPIAADS